MLVATVCQNTLGGLVKGPVPAWSVVLAGNGWLCPAEERAPGATDPGAQWGCLRRSLARLPRPARVPVAEMIRAYETRTGTWIGCD